MSGTSELALHRTHRAPWAGISDALAERISLTLSQVHAEYMVMGGVCKHESENVLYSCLRGGCGMLDLESYLPLGRVYDAI